MVRKTVKKVVQVRRKNDEKDQTELEIVDVGATETSDATAHDIVAMEELKISEKVSFIMNYYFVIMFCV